MNYPQGTKPSTMHIKHTHNNTMTIEPKFDNSVT